MKLILVVTATVLLPLGIITAVWANPAESTAQSGGQSGAAALGTQEAEVTESSNNESDRLASLANNINQGVGQQSRQTEQPAGMPSLNNFLNLPEDMVVRGTQRGGLAIGREF